MSNDDKSDSAEPLARWREDIVAYLDGEIDADGAQRIERAISDDEQVRRELQELDAAWQALDELPRAQVDEKFTTSSLEMAAISLEEEVSSAKAEQPVRKRAWWIKTAAISAAALFFGVWLPSLFWPHANDRLIADLPLIENIDAYRQVESIDFVRMLVTSGKFTTPIPGQVDTVNLSTGNSSTGETLAERRTRIGSMNQNELERLSLRLERFEALSAEEKSSLRTLHAAIEADPNAPQMRLAIDRYYDWLTDLNTTQRGELRPMPPVERFDKVMEIWSQNLLSKEDGLTIFHWMSDLMEAKFDTLPPDVQQRADQANPQIRAFILVREAHNCLQPSDADFELLSRDLSFSGAAHLAEAKTAADKLEVILAWQREGMRRFTEGSARPMDDAQIRRMIQNLPEDERERLLRLPKAEQEKRLREMLGQRRRRGGFRQDRPPGPGENGAPGAGRFGPPGGPNGRGEGRGGPLGFGQPRPGEPGSNAQGPGAQSGPGGAGAEGPGGPIGNGPEGPGQDRPAEGFEPDGHGPAPGAPPGEPGTFRGRSGFPPEGFPGPPPQGFPGQGYRPFRPDGFNGPRRPAPNGPDRPNPDSPNSNETNSDEPMPQGEPSRPAGEQPEV